MTFFSKIFAPTRNRRLNELVGFLLCVSALLLFLALASYSPLDPSLNSASILTGSHAARNWIGILGAYLSDLVLQFWGVGSFLLPVFHGDAGRALVPLARGAGSDREDAGRNLAADVSCPRCWPFCRGICAGWARFRSKAWSGRIVGDVLIRYLNVAGAYIVCTTVLAVALYLTTAFSFSAIELWAPTRFAFVVALRDRFKDWQDERERKRQQKELEKRRAEKPAVTAQLVPRAPTRPRRIRVRKSTRKILRSANLHDAIAARRAQEIRRRALLAAAPRTGIERMMASEDECVASRRPQASAPAAEMRDRSHRPRRHRAQAEDDSPEDCGQLQAAAVEPAASSRRAASRSRRRTQTHGAGSDREVCGVRRPRASHADQSWPGGHDLRVQARSRHQVQPHHRAHRRSLLSAARGKHSGRTHAGQEHGRHSGAEPRARDHLAAREHRVAGIPRHRNRNSRSRWAKTSTDASPPPTWPACRTC